MVHFKFVIHEFIYEFMYHEEYSEIIYEIRGYQLEGSRCRPGGAARPGGVHSVQACLQGGLHFKLVGDGVTFNA